MSRETPPTEAEFSTRQALVRLPGFDAARADAATLTPLDGLTNRVFRIDSRGETFALRIPGDGSAAIIDRRVEERNARAAAAAGVAPLIIYFGADGLMLTRFVEGAVTLSPERFRSRPGAVERAAHALRRLHQTARDFVRDFQVFAIVDDYVRLLSGRAALPEHFRDAIAEAAGIRAALAKRPAERWPCHCDPTGPNLLDTGARVWLIDWEYSGMNDPTWDLAYLSLEGRFDAGLDARLLRAYFGHAPIPAETGRFIIHKPLCLLLASLWALIQHAAGNRAADFRAYAEEALAACRAEMRMPALAAALQAVRRG
jgi:thiamine kinase-like enzyme